MTDLNPLRQIDDPELLALIAEKLRHIGHHLQHCADRILTGDDLDEAFAQYMSADLELHELSSIFRDALLEAVKDLLSETVTIQVQAHTEN